MISRFTGSIALLHLLSRLGIDGLTVSTHGYIENDQRANYFYGRQTSSLTQSSPISISVYGDYGGWCDVVSRNTSSTSSSNRSIYKTSYYDPSGSYGTTTHTASSSPCYTTPTWSSHESWSESASATATTSGRHHGSSYRAANIRTARYDPFG